MKKLSFPKILTANALKFIAILAMTLDHFAWLHFPGYSTETMPLWMHLLGRITCPIMCYFIAEGFHYTRDIRRYTGRLLICAVFSHFAYRFTFLGCIDFLSFLPFSDGRFLGQTSVIWSLLCGLIMLRIYYSTRFSALEKTLLILLCCLAALPADWNCIASLCVLSIGSHRGKPKEQLLWCSVYMLLFAVLYAFAYDPLYALIQLVGVFLSVPLLMFYNGKRGQNAVCNRIMKWFFYLYYPLHILTLGILYLFYLI